MPKLFSIFLGEAFYGYLNLKENVIKYLFMVDHLIRNINGGSGGNYVHSPCVDFQVLAFLPKWRTDNYCQICADVDVLQTRHHQRGGGKDNGQKPDHCGRDDCQGFCLK